MIWATWRMERALFAVALGAIGAVAILLVVTGAHQESAWTAFSGLHCNQPGSSTTCMAAADRYYSSSDFSAAGVGIGVAIPGLLGLVLGAPLVGGEIAQRTNRLAWTQTMTRSRWLTQKLAVGAFATMAIIGVLMPLVQWWTGEVQRGDRIVSFNFDVSGFAPVFYGLFAFMLGALLGSLIHRTGWAFAAGVVLFAAFRFIVRLFVRPVLIPPVTTTVAPTAPSNAWVLNEGFVPLGRASPAPGRSWQSANDVIAGCTNRVGRSARPVHTIQQCAALHKLHYVFQLQPGGHYWALQAAESAVFLAASCVLFALTVLAVQRWRT